MDTGLNIAIFLHLYLKIRLVSQSKILGSDFIKKSLIV